MDVRIGISQVPRELEVDLGAAASQEEVLARVEEALGKEDGILWFTDRRGRRVGVPSKRIAYVEIGAEEDVRRVGFGTT